MQRLKSVLLVDDDETTNFLNKFFVKQIYPELIVNEVGNGEEAIEFLKVVSWEETLPCMIILDTNMPIMNGWDFLNVYDVTFEEEFKRMVVVVMLTALDTEESVAKASIDPNVADTAQKPLSDIKFRGLIKKHFS